MCYWSVPANSGPPRTASLHDDVITHGATTVHFHPTFALIPVLAVAGVLGMSFAIVGTGHRKAWIVVLPIVIATWFAIEHVIALFSSSTLLTIFWVLALPVVLCVAAWIFRRVRERRGVSKQMPTNEVGRSGHL